MSKEIKFNAIVRKYNRITVPKELKEKDAIEVTIRKLKTNDRKE